MRRCRPLVVYSLSLQLRVPLPPVCFQRKRANYRRFRNKAPKAEALRQKFWTHNVPPSSCRKIERRAYGKIKLGIGRSQKAEYFFFLRLEFL
mmetsp:Transcript_41405/g.81669  ORF Transcript_41405/g.81669 Transcript_41405/m.81669 type:complete len:92 (-) Transcript_41405:434-709(-)